MNPAKVPGQNWIFLGDSLTEGVGSKRVSYVAELAQQLRADAHASDNGRLAVHELRLRKVDPRSFDRFIQFNIAGFLNSDDRPAAGALWLWNFACEGQTVDGDRQWLPLIKTLRPQLVIVHRGALESILRPAALSHGAWPWWVPQAWRGYAAMDPRCYYSRSPWRRVKQAGIDALKQRLRLGLLARQPGRPLMELDQLEENISSLLQQLATLSCRTVVLGLLPVDNLRFPDSPNYFHQVNRRLAALTASAGAEFIDWGGCFAALANRERLFYRDGFHPNLAGAQALAGILLDRLKARGV